MNYQEIIISEIKKICKTPDILDLIDEYERLIQKDEISVEEYKFKYLDLSNNYRLEMSIIESGNFIAQTIGKVKYVDSTKIVLLEIIYKLILIKVFN